MKNKIKLVIKLFKFYYSYLDFNIFKIWLLSLVVSILDIIGVSFIFTGLTKFNQVSEFLLNSKYFPFLTNENIIIFLSAVTIIIFSIKSIIVFYSLTVSRNLTSLLEKRLRNQLFRSLLFMNYDVFTTLPQGKIHSTINTEVEQFVLGFKNLTQILQIVSMSLIYLTGALYINYIVTSLIIFFSSIYLLILYTINKKTKSASNDISKVREDIQRSTNETINNFELIKISQLTKKVFNLQRNNINVLYNLKVKLNKYESIVESLREPILLVCLLSSLWITNLFFSLDLNLLLGVALIYKGSNSIGQLSILINKFISKSGSLSSIIYFKNLPGNLPLKLDTNYEFKELEFKNVEFKSSSRLILSNFSFLIKKNEFVLIKGESGKGKSTVLKLIVGLITPNKGSLFFNKEKLTENHISWIRGNLVFLPQKDGIFSESIFHNISLFDDYNIRNKDKATKLLKDLDLLNFNKKDDFLEQVISPYSTNLSGGERQRLLITRMIYLNKEIVLLDEPTSALDSMNKDKIKSILKGLKGKKTIIIVSHDDIFDDLADKTYLL